MNENCKNYEKKERKQCKKDQERLNDFSGKAMGRAFFSHNRIEIYFYEIEFYTPNSFSYREGEVYFYSTIAHEFLHIALYKKAVPTGDHHSIMLVKNYLDNLIDFLSTRLELKNNSDPKERSFKSLERGIKNDWAENQTLKRLYQSPHIEGFFEIN